MNKLNFNKNASKDSKLTVQFDPADYVQYLDGMDVTEAEATEILRTLWDIMIEFVDLGFTVNDTAESKSHSVAAVDSKTNTLHNTKGHTS